MPARILLIEDNRENLELMAYLLRAYGHKPLSVGDGEAGLEAARSQLPDLIVSDLRLPQLDGCEVARKVKSDPALKAIPLIAVSALHASGSREEALAAGFDAFIPKPIMPRVFVDQVQAFLAPAQRSIRPSSTPTPGTPAPQTARRGVTILAVDDREINLALIHSMLDPLGYQVVSTHSVAEGLACARQNKPDLILTDVHMGDGTGFDLVKAVKADPNLASIPCVITSATYLEADPRAREVVIDGNKVTFLLHPLTPKVFVAQIEASLAGRQTATPSETSTA